MFAKYDSEGCLTPIDGIEIDGIEMKTFVYDYENSLLTRFHFNDGDR